MANSTANLNYERRSAIGQRIRAQGLHRRMHNIRGRHPAIAMMVDGEPARQRS
jgi:hypothetical protein